MEKILNVYERRNMERSVLKAFAAEGLTQESLSELEQITHIVERVREQIKAQYQNLEPVTMTIAKDEEESKYYVEIRSQRNGLARRTLIDFNLTESPSYGEVMTIIKKVREVGEPPFTTEADGMEMEVPSFSGLVDLILEQGRKKLSIQRYKGLGEMNADRIVGNHNECRESANPPGNG